MRFYDALQLDPKIIKDKIKAADTKNEKNWFRKVLVIRALLITGFAILFISALSAVFGNENSPMAVVIFCILLCARFVDYDYNIKDSLINMGVIFAILLFCPLIVQDVNPFAGLLINFISIMTILVMSSERPEMGNGGLYMFGYIFLTGGSVDPHGFIGRALMTLVGFAICGHVFYKKHRHKEYEKEFSHVVSKLFTLDRTRKWQYAIAIGNSLCFFIGEMMGLERLMWAGFACSSILCGYVGNVESMHRKAVDRIIGVVIGTTLFFIIYPFVPSARAMMLGPISGFCLGFCGEYRTQTIFNCFGALLMATQIYGMEPSLLMRISNNLLGVVLAVMLVILGRTLYSYFENIVSDERVVSD